MTRGGADARASLRELPSVSTLLGHPDLASVAATAGRPVLVNAIRAALARMRAAEVRPEKETSWVELVMEELARASASSLRRAINATGVVLHTNLGRAPLAPVAVDAIVETARGYSTLEYDLQSGERGSRDTHCSGLLRDVTGAEDALVLNNCAAALVLALNTLAAGRTVIISRGELIEIGGSFRIPDIMARSSALLVEVGTTNRTHVLDYRAAVTEQTAAIVKVHRSNFTQAGFTADVSLRELATLAADRSLPLVFDLGSGLLIDLQRYGFPSEPTAKQAIADGADVVLMSGDKLLGGPQAGIVAGRSDLVRRMRANPLARAFRADKLTLAALEATLRLYLNPAAAVCSVPVLEMLVASQVQLRERANSVAGALRERGHEADVVESFAAVGAGAFPAHDIPSAAVALNGDAQELGRRLRHGEPPVIGLIRDGRLLLDLRSVLPDEDRQLLDAVHRALAA